MPTEEPLILPSDPFAIAHAARLLRQGEVCAFPTETVYGLGADATNEQAVRRIFLMKGRPLHNPLIVHVADVAMARLVVASWPPRAQQLAELFWPGPLSLVLPKAAKVPGVVSAGLDTVAVRIPAHPVALSLLAAAQIPLAAPSANRSEAVSPTTAQHVQRSLPHLGLILDGGSCRLGIESTVVDLSCTPPRLLRPGALPLRELLQALPDLTWAAWNGHSTEAQPSPGLSLRHYAPKAPLFLIDPEDGKRVTTLPAPRGLVTHSPLPDIAPLCAAIEYMPTTPLAYGADLYAALHRLDDRQVRSIAVLRPPQDPDFCAIWDRLQRAAQKNA